jgi:predicted  nucleic acid-binding Zn-ribbon protein
LIVIFSDAEMRLQQLEAEKQNLDAELQAAREKVKRTEEAQILLETQLVTTRPRSGERIRRTQSFIPTTKERPLIIDDRVSLQKDC